MSAEVWKFVESIGQPCLRKFGIFLFRHFFTQGVSDSNHFDRRQKGSALCVTVCLFKGYALLGNLFLRAGGGFAFFLLKTQTKFILKSISQP